MATHIQQQPHPFRVLAVDDDEDIRSLIFSSLEYDFEVLHASDGLDCLQKLAVAEPDFIILDVMMPLMNGLKTCEAIRRDETFSAIPILLLSALNSSAEIKDGYKAGANLYLTKPFDPVRLLKMVHSELERAEVSPREKKYQIHKFPDIYDRLSRANSGGAAPSPGRSRDQYLWQPAEENVQIIYPSDSPAAKAAAKKRGQPENAPTPTAARPRLMIVDDEEDVRRLLVNDLCDDFEVAEATDGIEAVEKIVRYEPDLIIIDGMMPRMTGFQLVQSIRRNKRYQRTPVLFLSAKSSDRDRSYATSMGANAFMAKPFDLDEVRAKLDELMEGKDFYLYPKRISYEDLERVENRDRVDQEKRDRDRTAVQSGLKIPPSAVSESYQAIREFMRDEKDLKKK